MAESLRDLKKLWGRFIAVIYILSFIFSLVAIILTVIGMSRWWFVRESVEEARSIFSTFGSFWGAVLIGLWSAGGKFGPPILIVILLRYVENGEFAVNLTRFVGWAFIEAYGVYNFSMSFLDMYNNLFVLNLILYEKLVYPPLTETIIISVANPLFLTVFVLSFSLRTVRYLRQRDFRNFKFFRKRK
jgi:hypothetical protein